MQDMSQLVHKPSTSNDYTTSSEINVNNYDSVSIFSGTSTVDSEFMERKIKTFESERETTFTTETSNNQINLQISVINTGGPAPVDYSLEHNNINIHNNDNVNHHEPPARYERIFCYDLKVLVSVIVVSVILVGTSIGSTFLFTKNDNKPTEISILPTQEASFFNSSQMSTTSIETTTKKRFLFEVITRKEWKAIPKSLGKKKLSLPVERIIVMDTKTETCDSLESCKTFVLKYQKDSHSSPFLTIHMNDIPENFLIAPDGSIFEGRGFSLEGQHTFDYAKTSYNNGALGITFIGDYTEKNLTADQLECFNYFNQKSIDDNMVKTDYKLYYKGQLAGILTSNVTDQLYETVRSFDHWKEIPTMIRNRAWGSAPKGGPSFNLFKDIHRKAVIEHSGGSSCVELKDCVEILKEIQRIDNAKYSDIKQAFILAGKDFIFEGRGFDRSHSPGHGLVILFLGDFKNAPPPTTLLHRLDAFLQYAIDLGKLTADYELYGERQLRSTTSPGDELFRILQNPPFDRHFNFNVTEPDCSYFRCDQA